MKTKTSPKASKAASALLTVLVICSILAMTVAYYISFIEQQDMLSMRSQYWNMAISVAEAGIEEGVEEINTNPTNPGLDGWTNKGTYYTISRQLADGNSYFVDLFVTNPAAPAVFAQANIVLPTFANGQGNVFAAAGVTPNSGLAKRAVQVMLTKPPTFNAAVVVKQNIDLMGNGVYSDSFDSTNPSKSSNHVYCSTLYSGDKGDMVTNGGITNSVNVQNGNIYGTVHTGPNCPVSIGPNGGVGPHCCQTSDLNTAIADGYVRQDANFTFPDTKLPDTAGFLPPSSGTLVTPSNYVATSSAYPSPPPAGLSTNAVNVANSPTLPSPTPPVISTNWTTTPTTGSYPGPGTYVGSITTNYNGSSGNIKNYSYNLITGWTYNYTTYTYSYPNTVYYTNYWANIMYGGNNYVAYSLASNSIALINPTTGATNVNLVMPNGMTGIETITVWQGANILICAGGTSFTAAGNQIINQNGTAGSFLVYCAPSVTSFSLAGNGTFTGVLVAPNANVALKGSGNNNDDFSGALVANSITLNGHFSFHYDESLAGQASNGRFLIKSWNEVVPQ